MIIALAGGVGGAKLARGLAAILPPEELTIIVNTADDFTHWGLSISPDLDTVMYNLAGINNPETGWGIAEETWQVMQSMKRLGGEEWFQIGDQDLATHIERTRLLTSGFSLSEVSNHLCKKLGLKHIITPMTDDTIETIIHTGTDIISFQNYFVKMKCQPIMQTISFRGADTAVASPKFSEMLAHPKLSCIIICPSNPILSIAPILAIPDVQKKIKQANVPVIAVSPFIKDQALKGPAAKIFRELNLDVSVIGIAHFYHDLISGIVIDFLDNHYQENLKQLDIIPCVTSIFMKDLQDSIQLAQTILDFSKSINK